MFRVAKPLSGRHFDRFPRAQSCSLLPLQARRAPAAVSLSELTRVRPRTAGSPTLCLLPSSPRHAAHVHAGAACVLREALIASWMHAHATILRAGTAQPLAARLLGFLDAHAHVLQHARLSQNAHLCSCTLAADNHCMMMHSTYGHVAAFPVVCSATSDRLRCDRKSPKTVGDRLDHRFDARWQPPPLARLATPNWRLRPQLRPALETPSGCSPLAADHPLAVTHVNVAHSPLGSQRPFGKLGTSSQTTTHG